MERNRIFLKVEKLKSFLDFITTIKLNILSKINLLFQMALTTISDKSLCNSKDQLTDSCRVGKTKSKIHLTRLK